MATSNGNCFICGKTAGKMAIKNHVIKEHSNGDEPCYLIKAEGAYSKSYWLLFTVPIHTTLSVLDTFFRQIWCECCGHLSAFRIGGREYSESQKLSNFSIGDTLLYEYDFGSTTAISITIIAEASRPKQSAKVQLLARNAPPQEKCEQCGAPATVVNAWEYEVLCDKCAESRDYEAMMPIVNSPRSGVCGYDGDQDIWIFDPSKPFPQPQKAKAKRGGRR